MILNGLVISDHQACARRTSLNAEFRVMRWRPKALFDACLRRAITRMTCGDAPEVVSSDAVAVFMQAAANPGLDTMSEEVYDLAKDWAVMLEILPRFLANFMLLRLHQVPDIKFGKDTWQVMAWADDSGTLHRWITSSRWDEDDLARELHGWHSFGDIVMTGQNMKLHVIEIGQTRNGRQVGPWARAFKNPLVGSHLRFRRTDGSAFNGWKGAQLSSLPPKYDDWAAQMFKEGMGAYCHNLEISCPDDTTRDDARNQIAQIADSMNETTDHKWHEIPMARSACDGLVPCPWQYACYGQTHNLHKIGLYQPRKTDLVAQAAQAVGGK